MRLIDADALKGKLIKIQANIADKKVARGSSKSDAWMAAYLLILDEYIKMVDEMPSATQHYDCNHDCDAIYGSHIAGFLKGREDALSEVQLMKDYCENDCDTLREVYNKVYSEGDKND